MKNQENQPVEETQPEAKVVMQLILTREGKLIVTGQVLQDKVACYGLLEAAKDEIRKLHEPKIIPVGGRMHNFVRGLVNGKH